MHSSLRPFTLALSLALAAATAVGCGGPYAPSAPRWESGRPAPMGQLAGGGKFHAKQLSSDKSRFSKHHLAVRFAAGAKGAIAGAKVRDGLNGYQVHALPAGTTVEAAIAEYQRMPGVAAIEPLELFPMEQEVPRSPAPKLAANDKLYFQQWSHHVGHVPEAWQVSRGRPDVVVAVLDTGVDYTHPDLAGQVINGPDFAENRDDSKDIGTHGTHVAGIIAAKGDNGEGVVGVAPGAKVLALKVFEPYVENGKFQGLYYNAFSLARALQYAATQGGAKVINISAGVGGDELVQTMFDFARGRGLVICVSAGNKSSNTYTGDPKHLDGVLAVHATDAQDRLATFSNFGSLLGVSAPGVSILSTVPTYADPFTGEAPHPGGYDTKNGTSMASPYVAGVAALVVSALLDQTEAYLSASSGRAIKLKPSDIPPALVEDLIRSTTYDLGRRGNDEMYGTGRVDAGRALEACRNPQWIERAAKAAARERSR